MRWDVPNQLVRQDKRDEFLLPLPFVLFGPSRDWKRPTHMGRVIYCVHWWNAILIQKLPTQIYPEIMINLGTLWPVKLIHKINHHSWFLRIIPQYWLTCYFWLILLVQIHLALAMHTVLHINSVFLPCHIRFLEGFLEMFMLFLYWLIYLRRQYRARIIGSRNHP